CAVQHLFDTDPQDPNSPGTPEVPQSIRTPVLDLPASVALMESSKLKRSGIVLAEKLELLAVQLRKCRKRDENFVSMQDLVTALDTSLKDTDDSGVLPSSTLSGAQQRVRVARNSCGDDARHQEKEGARRRQGVWCWSEQWWESVEEKEGGQYQYHTRSVYHPHSGSASPCPPCRVVEQRWLPHQQRNRAKLPTWRSPAPADAPPGAPLLFAPCSIHVHTSVLSSVLLPTFGNV
ncbi:hypothetical protein K438DRAFT_2110489, partial [Mycena galopus ATCC 62051]